MLFEADLGLVVELAGEPGEVGAQALDGRRDLVVCGRGGGQGLASVTASVTARRDRRRGAQRQPEACGVARDDLREPVAEVERGEDLAQRRRVGLGAHERDELDRRDVAEPGLRRRAPVDEERHVDAAVLAARERHSRRVPSGVRRDRSLTSPGS
jgi:hypothetical protein